MKIAVFGVTGLVGGVMLDILAQRNFPVTELIPIASAKSAGKTVSFQGKQWTVLTPQQGLSKGPQIALFSAGGDTSLIWAEQFAQKGCYVIDNSSAWRMDPTKKLIIPEINGQQLTPQDLIIANPNCSTIQMLMALAPLHKALTINRIVVSTYQGITGSGIKAVNQMECERQGIEPPQKAYQYTIDKNCIPQCDAFLENDYTKEEMKLVNETHKILCDNSILISPTAVRVPVVGGHSESVNVELKHPFTITQIREILQNSPGITLQDDPKNAIYPMARHAQGSDQVFVGRIRQDISNNKAINMWIVSDNLRKGAATNAVQIAEIIAGRWA